MPPMRDQIMVKGKAIRKARLALGWSQARLAAEARISRSYLSEMELDKKQPGVRIVERLADILEVPFENLVREKRRVL